MFGQDERRIRRVTPPRDRSEPLAWLKSGPVDTRLNRDLSVQIGGEIIIFNWLFIQYPMNYIFVYSFFIRHILFDKIMINIDFIVFIGRFLLGKKIWNIFHCISFNGFNINQIIRNEKIILINIF